KLLRDLLTDEFQAIRIDNPHEHALVLELIERIMPNLAPRVKLYSKPYPIFDDYGVQAEIDKALKSKVWLKSGGSIVMNHTSAVGHVMIQRKRVKQRLQRVLTEPCSYCSGTGTIKSSSTICYEILSEVKKVGPELNGHRLLLRVNPDIARALEEEESEVVKDLKQSTGKDVTIKADAHLHHEQFDVMAV